MGRLDGKVAFISGVARGQGRSHAVRLAAEGADIIGFDICKDFATVEYPMASEEELIETAKMVEALGQSIVAEVADVRDRSEVERVLNKGLATFGHVDIVIANAGISSTMGEVAESHQAWDDSIATMLTGTFNTVDLAYPHMIERGQGGSIVITSSTNGLRGFAMFSSAGGMAYTAAKHGVVGLMRAWANLLGPHNIRVNTVHPTGVNTMMATNDRFVEFCRDHPGIVEAMTNALPIQMMDTVDVSNAVVFLCSDEGRYITGTTMAVDAGCTNKN